jgi:hypothetical protein
VPPDPGGERHGTARLPAGVPAQGGWTWSSGPLSRRPRQGLGISEQSIYTCRRHGPPGLPRPARRGPRRHRRRGTGGRPGHLHRHPPGEFLGIPATGKQTTTNGVDLFRIQDGRQAEHWGGPDTLSFPHATWHPAQIGHPSLVCRLYGRSGFELTSWPSRTSSRVRRVRPRPPRELNSDRRHKSGRERPAIAVHRRHGC